MTGTEVIVTVVVGFGSGLVGALAGGWAQRWVYRVRREDERLDDLWDYHRCLKVVSEHLTDERTGDKGIDLREVEARISRHFRYLPEDLIKALEVDEAAGTRTSFEIGENLWVKAMVLKKYLDRERHPVRDRLVKARKVLKQRREQ